MGEKKKRTHKINRLIFFFLLRLMLSTENCQKCRAENGNGGMLFDCANDLSLDAGLNWATTQLEASVLRYALLPRNNQSSLLFLFFSLSLVQPCSQISFTIFRPSLHNQSFFSFIYFNIIKQNYFVESKKTTLCFCLSPQTTDSLLTAAANLLEVL